MLSLSKLNKNWAFLKKKTRDSNPRFLNYELFAFKKIKILMAPIISKESPKVHKIA